jgi:hypothetical protein
METKTQFCKTKLKRNSFGGNGNKRGTTCNSFDGNENKKKGTTFSGGVDAKTEGISASS